jgi:hypothetical protein
VRFLTYPDQRKADDVPPLRIKIQRFKIQVRLFRKKNQVIVRLRSLSMRFPKTEIRKPSPSRAEVLFRVGVPSFGSDVFFRFDKETPPFGKKEANIF